MRIRGHYAGVFGTTHMSDLPAPRPARAAGTSQGIGRFALRTAFPTEDGEDGRYPGQDVCDRPGREAVGTCGYRHVMTPDEIEVSIELPESVLYAVVTETARQDSDRGDWGSPRAGQQPDAPWPATNSPIFAYLLLKATASIAAGMPVRDACITLAAHSWFEGGVENYDRGQVDARSI